MEEVRLYFIIAHTPFVKVWDGVQIRYFRVLAEDGKIVERPVKQEDRVLLMDSMAEREWVNEAVAFSIARDPDYFSHI